MRDWAVAVPAVLLAVASGLFVVDATGGTERSKTEMKVALPQTVTIKPRTMTYRADGDFQKNNYPVDAPLTTRKLRRSFEIMKYQVTGAEYRRCVDDGACQPPEDLPHNRNWASADKPVVGVSYTDAEDYAAWLSKKTGSVWHLPTDEQWAFAAGTRFADDAVGIEGDKSKIRRCAGFAIMSSKVPVSRIVTRPFGRLVLLAKMNTALPILAAMCGNGRKPAIAA